MSQSHPLQWPAGWPRTKSSSQVEGRFTSKNGSSYAKPVTIAVAVERVFKELERMGYDNYMVIVSSNLLLRNDGLPRSGQPQPNDVGVAVYFREYGSEPGTGKVIPCDKFTRVEQNLAAVAGTVEALRRLERYGSGIMERAFTGFTALPGADDSTPHWSVVLGVSSTAMRADIEYAYRKLRSEHHPDTGGDSATFNQVQNAWAEYLAEC